MARTFLAVCLVFPWLALPLLSAGAQEGSVGPNAGSEPPLIVELSEDGIQRAAITMDSYFFRPNQLVVKAGYPVEFVLTSETIITPHNFVLKEPTAGLQIDESVGAGDSVSVRFTPTQSGIFTFYCDKKLLFFPSHREEGMEGILEVRE
ncbi:MAG: cupredoxin domain-containing protein [Nitrospirales bacterium]